MELSESNSRIKSMKSYGLESISTMPTPIPSDYRMLSFPQNDDVGISSLPIRQKRSREFSHSCRIIQAEIETKVQES